jgi:deoxyribose-phosphate aldolase
LEVKTLDKNKILNVVDHTLLKPAATWDEIKIICDDAIKYSTASVCIPPSYVKQCKEYCGDKMKICTVIGFPNGYNTTAVKIFETVDAIANGADEIDMVINIGWLKNRKYDDILNEIKGIKKACRNKVLKVIIEICLLSDEEKIKMCQIVTEAGADFIKTSTGFSTNGATFDDIELFAKNVGSSVKIKAAGGIKDFDDANKFIKLGANRLGTSRLITLAKDGDER